MVGRLVGWILQEIIPLRGRSCKVRLARISAKMKFHAGPECGNSTNWMNTKNSIDHTVQYNTQAHPKHYHRERKYPRSCLRSLPLSREILAGTGSLFQSSPLTYNSKDFSPEKPLAEHIFLNERKPVASFLKLSTEGQKMPGGTQNSCA